MQLSPKSILITGASSGIGAALASAYARKGVVLSLLGRDEQRLAEVAQRCEARGAIVEVILQDVTDGDGMTRVVKETDRHAPLDLVVANAGIGRNKEDPAFARQIINTNIVGVLNTVEPAVALMAARGHGHVAIMSSLAAFRAYGGPPGYAASKAWARLYGEALRGRLARSGVAVSVICPGFVTTPMTEKSGYRGMSAEDAAEIIKSGLSRNKVRISFPAGMGLRTWLSSLLPSSWTDRGIRRKWKAARDAEQP